MNRYGYAMVEGAGGAPSVFQAGLQNVFDVALPVANGLVPFATWFAVAARELASQDDLLRDVERPVHRSPQIPVAQKIIGQAG